MVRTERALQCLLCNSPGEWPAAGLRAWLGLRAHSGSVVRRMSKDPAPVGDDVLFLLEICFMVRCFSEFPQCLLAVFLTNGL